jgi:hypothetical protein
MSPLTLFLAKLFGVFGVLMCAALVARPKASIATIQSMMESPGLILVTGIVTMAAGAATVIGHNVWTGGVLAVVVTALGWGTLIKGLALIAVPPSALGGFYRFMRYPRSFGPIMAVALVLSVWLTWAAFTAAPALAP